MSKVYILHAVQTIPVSMEQAWNFFSRPNNLKDITPAAMGFEITSRHHGENMYAGQIIEYKVRAVAGIPMYWMTEITHVEEGKYFVDEQRFGPYSFWHHQHYFSPVPGGVEMTDLVHYKIPFGFIGTLAHSLFVKKQLRYIFDYRRKKIEQTFGRIVK